MNSSNIDNGITLAVAANLAQVIMTEVVGNEVSDTMNGVTLTASLLNEVILVNFQNHINKELVTQ